MKAELTSFNNESNLISGTVDEYQFEAELFDVESSNGINNGRVSKLTIWNEKGCIVEGWEIRPKREHRKYFNAVMELIENTLNNLNI